jgi:NAD(P)-dependent dehydrogenase (short-subunit alcohol dehydrogenase family)
VAVKVLPWRSSWFNTDPGGSDMRTALVIGASRGIGREFVRQLLQDGWKVYATARNGKALDDLRTAGAEALKVDVAKPESLAGLGWQLDDVKLDLAIYVAGVIGPNHSAMEPPTVAAFDATMHTNVLGAMQAMPLVAPLVEAAGGRFVFISSGLGSIAEASSSGSWWVYRVSKAALNMAVKSAAFDYPKATFIAMSPGWVQTDMGGPNAEISAEQSVADMLRVVAKCSVKDSGSFLNHSGEIVPW